MKKAFTYTLSLHPNDDPNLESKAQSVRQVKFNTSRCGKHHHTLYFTKSVTKKTAMEAAEDYLSKPLTQDYYDIVKDDLFHDIIPWVAARGFYECRGDCLIDCCFLESLQVDKAGCLVLVCGS